MSISDVPIPKFLPIQILKINGVQMPMLKTYGLPIPILEF